MIRKMMCLSLIAASTSLNAMSEDEARTRLDDIASFRDSKVASESLYSALSPQVSCMEDGIISCERFKLEYYADDTVFSSLKRRVRALENEARNVLAMDILEDEIAEVIAEEVVAEEIADRDDL